LRDAEPFQNIPVSFHKIAHTF